MTGQQSVVFISRLIDWTECDVVVTEHRRWCHVRVKLHSWKAVPGAGLFLQTLLLKDQWRAKKAKEQRVSVSQGDRGGRAALIRYTLIVLTLPLLIFSPALTGKNVVNPLHFVRRQSLEQRSQLKWLQLRALTPWAQLGPGFSKCVIYFFVTLNCVQIYTSSKRQQI